MKVNAKRESTKLAERAIQRPAIGVLGKAVQEKESIPILDGEKIVCKVPENEFEQVNTAYAVNRAAD